MKVALSAAGLALLATRTLAAEQMVDSVSGMLTTCTQEALVVNLACCASQPSACATGNIPTTCPSAECARRYMPFYHQCSQLIRPIEQMMPNQAQFSELYSSCVSMAGQRDVHGHVVDTTVQSNTLYNFGTAAADVSGWHVTVDGVMGGRSHGTFTENTQHTCAEFSGTIELEHGGFVVVRGPTITPAHSLGDMDGIRICSKGTTDYGLKDGIGDLYKLTLSDGSRNSWRADFHTSETGAPDTNPTDDCDGVVSTVPFAQFYPSHYGQITGAQGSIDASAIDGVGLEISFQTDNGGINPELDHEACAQHHDSCQNLNPFGICVQWIQGYSNNDARGDAPRHHHGRGGN